MSNRSVNQVFLKGFITKDIKLRKINKGKPYVIYRIGINWFNTKTQQSEPTFLTLLTNGKDAEMLSKKGKKGTEVFVTGFLRSSDYTDKNGQQREAIEVITTNVALTQHKAKKQNHPEQAVEPDQPEKQEISHPSMSTPDDVLVPQRDSLKTETKTIEADASLETNNDEDPFADTIDESKLDIPF